MTVKELKAAIKDLPDNMDVMIEQTNDEYRYSLLNTGSIRDVTFSDGAEKAEDSCFILTD